MGVGNPLMRDDGIGPRVIELLLAGYTFPDNVEVVDAGTMSFMILDLLRGRRPARHHRRGGRTPTSPPGTVMRMTPEEIAPNQVAHSMHDVAARRRPAGRRPAWAARPQTIAIGVQIEAIEEWVLELSRAVEAAVPIAAAAVLDELAAIGVEPLAVRGRRRPRADHRGAALLRADAGRRLRAPTDCREPWSA